MLKFFHSPLATTSRRAYNLLFFRMSMGPISLSFQLRKPACLLRRLGFPLRGQGFPPGGQGFPLRKPGFLLRRPACLLRKPTSIEQRMKSFLEELGFRENIDFFPEFKMRLSNGSARIFDFYFPRKKIAVECDGSYWHKNLWKDNFKDIQAEWDKIKVIRFREEEILKSQEASIERLKMELISK